MKLFLNSLLLSCVLPLVASCVTASVNDGTGYKLLRPSAQTRSFIYDNDKKFVQDLAEHNTQCRKDEGCEK